MKKLLLTGVAVGSFLATTSVNAADLPQPILKSAAPPPVFSWTGCYAGVHGGWGLGKNDHRQVVVDPGLPVTVSSATTGIKTSGPVFGGQVGCDYQFGNLVVGAKGMAQGADINGLAVDALNTFFPNDDGIGSRTKWIASVTGRLGVVAFSSQTLIYVQGGAAWAEHQFDARNIWRDELPGIHNIKTNGWTVGGGLAWAFSQNWSAFAEYNYYSFADKTYYSVTVPGGPTNTLSLQSRIDTFTVGVNYRFDFGIPVRAAY